MSARGIACVLLVIAAQREAYPGGFEMGDVGARASGRAGAFVVRADDPSAIDHNPAGLARLRGTHILLSNRLTWDNEAYHRARTLDFSGAVHGVPPVTTFPWVSNAVTFEGLGPMLVVSSDFGLKDWGFAAGVYSPPSTSRQSFPNDGPQKYMLTSREVIILYYCAAAAWKYKETAGVGVTLQWVDVPRFRFSLVVDGNTTPRMVNPVSSRFDMESRVDGADRIGFTGIVGAWYRPLRNLELGFSARVIPVRIKTESHLALTALSLDLPTPPSITRNGVPDDRMTFSMVLPPKVRVGARYVYEQGEEEVADVELDLGYEVWSMLDAFVLDASQTETEVLGKRITIGTLKVPRHWRDTFSVRIGGDYRAVPRWLSVRAGVMYESPAVPPEYAYVDVFPGHRLAASAGFTFGVAGFDISAAYSYLFLVPVVVTEDASKVFQQVPGSPCLPPYTDTSKCAKGYLGKPAAPANAGTYRADYHFLAISASYSF